jgi:hypothetical protein
VLEPGDGDRPEEPAKEEGGGNVKKLKTLPPGCRPGGNKNAVRGGFRMWERVDAMDELPANDDNLPAKDSAAEGRNA